MSTYMLNKISNNSLLPIKSFTLVETLVAATLFAIIITATYRSYRLAMAAYSECENAGCDQDG